MGEEATCETCPHKGDQCVDRWTGQGRDGIYKTVETPNNRFFCTRFPKWKKVNKSHWCGEHPERKASRYCSNAHFAEFIKAMTDPTAAVFKKGSGDD